MPSRIKDLNPFAKHDVSEYPGVLIPLARGSSTSAPGNPRSPSSEEDIEKKSLGEKSATGLPQYKTSGPTDNSALTSTGTGDLESPRTLETLRAEIEDDVALSGSDTAYDRKSHIINKAIADIGMGRYQWQLFVLCGFGWLADNLWLQGVALTLPQLSAEFGIDDNYVRYTTLCLFIGLCIGASFWGIASDIIGRRLAFNFTLLIAGIFGIAAGAAPSWVGVCSLYACLGLGVGGNLPVDGALFLEFLPFASGNLLTLLSVWWPIGQLIASLAAWGFIVNYPVNVGWRYFIYTMGALTMGFFCCRFFLFHLFESPKFLLSRGRQSEAVAVIHGIAYHNKTKTWLTEDILNEIGGHPDVVKDDKLTTAQIIKRSLSKFSGQRIGPLFSTRTLGLSTALIWFIWLTIGMGYPLFNAFLPQYLRRSGGGENSENTQYRDYAITSVVGVPGSIIACYTVNIKYIGRKGTMAFATVVTGIFVILFTIATDAGFQLAMSCMEAFFQNIMYGVLYAYTPEVFPAPNRGTGTGIGSFLNRLAGLCAPIVAVNAGQANPKAPIFASAGLFFAAFLAMVVLPIETRGRSSL